MEKPAPEEVGSPKKTEEPAKEETEEQKTQDFNNSLASLIGRGRPEKFKRAPTIKQVEEPVKKKEVASIFDEADDDENDISDAAKLSAMKPNIKRGKRAI
eukprot:CAMPEP_0170495348 /NCGR_PEP_ID=MMETSP0208-20121228/15157_1 /TAXON_ID=197538 /ORGANISM="Strombidium inclinatum, Strain S3" /LENGTH=99 /DNA_ID=CAMNT_0010771525 /DNA_START=927 /DNA_END=1223 /DNA_ORIENTATION=-